MAFRVGSYPHPVLGHEDDVSSIFEVVNTTVAPAVEDVAIRFRLKTDDPDLQRLLKIGTAELVVTWSCPATLSSGQLDLKVTGTYQDGKSYVGWLDQRDLRGNFEIKFFAVATQAIPRHAWERQHLDYGKSEFAIRKGDIIAVAGGFEYVANKMYDPMQPPVGSCFRIIIDDHAERDIKLRFDDQEAVLILVSSEMATGLKALSFRPDYQISLVVLPALMETIQHIRETELDTSAEDLTGNEWYRTLELLVGDQLIGSSSALELAQKILSYPIYEVLNQPFLEEDDE